MYLRCLIAKSIQHFQNYRKDILLDAWVVGVVSEPVLLAIAGAEDIVSSHVDTNDGGGSNPAKIHWMDGEITCLDTVDERNPDEICIESTCRAL